MSLIDQIEKISDQLDEDLLSVVGGYGRCTYLLAASIILIILSPFGTRDEFGVIVFIVTSAIVYAFAIFVIEPGRRTLFALIAIAIITTSLETASVLEKSQFLFNLSVLFSAILYLYVIKDILHYILRRGPVTADKLHGAMAVYIMLAFLWAGIFVLVENLAPGSFLFSQEKTVGDPWQYNDLLFLSFSTLTGIGYGPVTPVSDYAHMLSILEQLVGVFFVAVLIARLAGVYPPQVRTEEKTAAAPGQSDETASG